MQLSGFLKAECLWFTHCVGFKANANYIALHVIAEELLTVPCVCHNVFKFDTTSYMVCLT